MYYYATPEHGILELKNVPPVDEYGTPYIPRNSKIGSSINPMINILESTPEEALKQLCWEVMCILDGVCYYRDVERNSVKKEKLWAQASKLVLSYKLYVSKKGMVSTTNDFGEEGLWFSFESGGLAEYVDFYGSSVVFLDNTWLPKAVPVSDSDHNTEPGSQL